MEQSVVAKTQPTQSDYNDPPIIEFNIQVPAGENHNNQSMMEEGTLDGEGDDADHHITHQSMH